MPSIAKSIEKEHGRQLTNRQRTFARHIVEGIYSNTECARKAGYTPDLANKQASVLLNGRDYPHVVEYIQELETKENDDMVSQPLVNSNDCTSCHLVPKTQGSFLPLSMPRR